LFSAPAQAQKAYAITGGKVHTVSGAVIDGGTVVIQGGKITAVGKGVSVPGGAQVINARGMHVYPGVFDAVSQMGLVEVGQGAPGTVDASEIGDYNPQIVAAAAIHPSSEHIPVSRAAGVTHTVSVPGQGGGRIGGQASLINLNGWVTEDMLVKRSIAMAINWPSLGAGGGGGGFGGFGQQARRPFTEVKAEYDRRVNELTDWLDRARHYAQALEKGSKEKYDRDLKLEALVPVIKGQLPVLVFANSDRDMKNAIEYCEKQKLKLILAGGRQAWKIKDLLKQKNIPVILQETQALPQSEDEPYDKPYTTPAELQAAGVKFAIATFAGGNSEVNSFGLPQEAGQAVAFGLPHEEAIKAITLYPAQFFGVGDMLGSIEPGKVANVIVTSGDLLELDTQVRYVFVAGQLTSLENKHTRLYEKYRARP
jgi:imidazolonepropionase-like amidohydrolase